MNPVIAIIYGVTNFRIVPLENPETELSAA